MRRSFVLFLVVGLSTAAITCTTIDNAPRGASVELRKLARVDARFDAGISSMIRDPGLFVRDEIDKCGDRMKRDVFTRKLRRVNQLDRVDITPEDLQFLRVAVQLKVDEGFRSGAAPADLKLAFGSGFASEHVGAPRQSITIGQ